MFFLNCNQFYIFIIQLVYTTKMEINNKKMTSLPSDLIIYISFFLTGQNSVSLPMRFVNKDWNIILNSFIEIKKSKNIYFVSINYNEILFSKKICDWYAKTFFGEKIIWKKKKLFNMDDYINNVIRTGNINFVKWLYSHTIPSKWNDSAYLEAIKSGHLNILQWLYTLRSSEDFIYPESIIVNEILEAIKSGHLDILQWLYSHKILCHHTQHYSNDFSDEDEDQNEDNDNEDNDDDNVNDYDNNIIYFSTYFTDYDTIYCSEASKAGHLQILQWLCKQNPPCPYDANCCSEAAKGGHLHILQWLREQNPPCPYDAKTWTEAVIEHRLDIIQWLLVQDSPCHFDNETCLVPIEAGDLDMLQLLYKQKDTWEENFDYIRDRARHWSQYHIIDWLIKECNMQPYNKIEQMSLGMPR
jgi:hypothetical protein